MPAIDNLLRAFERGDLESMDAVTTDDFDLRIEHYRGDDVDVSWQRCLGRAEFHAVLQRLASEVFEGGTRILSLDTQELGNGWTLSSFRQQFLYPVRNREVIGQTWILAHESDGRIDYFREIATPVENVLA
ncbi:hypothetical protein [Mesorhizobium sp. L-8-3]|uniref:hypothetical protein n=1 Tax=Mesorhizobium sp. L-8-3 TaxID=2744522 RepID=UPI0019276EBE|nr:hypothetical protein [Mesorhizobium sp. L-8-3]BCH24992.1 hypothetical protein MesoLjLb_47770 [Mesorhizobium sp. L-8-3]